jgi:nicotinamide mononucleotide transporter
MNWADFLGGIELGIRSSSVASWIATVTAIIYVILAARENIWCWPFGIITSAASVCVYYEYQLPFESILNIGYCFLGVYGWWKWAIKKGELKTGTEEKMLIKNSNGRQFIYLFLIGIVGTLIFGGISAYYKTSSLPWADAAITMFSIIATWMTAQKLIENWLLWIAVDSAAVIVYVIKGPEMYLFAVLFIVYTFMAVAGYFAWKKKKYIV